MLAHDVVVALRGFRPSPLPRALGVLVLAIRLACLKAAYVFVSGIRS